MTDATNFVERIEIRQDQVVFDEKVFTYCRLSYPGHSSGCPNVGKCIHDLSIEYKVKNSRRIYLYVRRFDMHCHFARNRRWWQPVVKRDFVSAISRDFRMGDLVLGCGSGFRVGQVKCNSMEAAGILVLDDDRRNKKGTLTKCNIKYERNPENFATMVAMLVKGKNSGLEAWI